MPQFPLYTKNEYGAFFKTTSHTTSIMVETKKQFGVMRYTISVIQSGRWWQYDLQSKFNKPSTADEFEKAYAQAHWNINKANTPQS